MSQIPQWFNHSFSHAVIGLMLPGFGEIYVSIIKVYYKNNNFVFFYCKETSITSCSSAEQSHVLSGTMGRIRMTTADLTYNLQCSWEINGPNDQVI